MDNHHRFPKSEYRPTTERYFRTIHLAYKEDTSIIISKEGTSTEIDNICMEREYTQIKV